MTELNKESAKLVQLLRNGDDPTVQQKTRVRLALASRIAAAGAGAATGLAVGSASATSTSLTTLAAKSIIAYIVVGGALGAGMMMTVVHTNPSTPLSSVSAVTQAPEPPTEQLKAPAVAVSSIAPPAPLPTRLIPPSKPSSSSITDELSVLKEANQAIAEGRVDEALRVLNAGTQQYPSGALLPEREFARILALCHSGQTELAQKAAGAFVVKYPQSPLVSRARTVCNNRVEKSPP